MTGRHLMRVWRGATAWLLLGLCCSVSAPAQTTSDAIVAPPPPTSTSLGGVKSSTCTSNQFGTGVDTGGNATCAQPASTNLSDTPKGAQAWSHPGYVVNNWYAPWGAFDTAAGTPINGGNGTVVCAYGVVAQKITINALGAYVKTGAASTNVQLAIYNNGSWGRPGTLIDKTASIATTASTTAVSAALGGNQQLTAGGYWFCANQDNTSAVLQAQSVGAAATQPSTIGSATLANVVQFSASVVPGIKIAQTYGTWPNFSSGSSWVEATTAIVPFVAFQVSSVP